MSARVQYRAHRTSAPCASWDKEDSTSIPSREIPVSGCSGHDADAPLPPSGENIEEKEVPEAESRCRPGPENPGATDREARPHLGARRPDPVTGPLEVEQPAERPRGSDPSARQARLCNSRRECWPCPSTPFPCHRVDRLLCRRPAPLGSTPSQADEAPLGGHQEPVERAHPTLPLAPQQPHPRYQESKVQPPRRPRHPRQRDCSCEAPW